MSVADRNFRDALKVLYSLEKAGFAARLAGGCVRDRLLGFTPVDYDIATDARPAVVLQHFRTEERTTVPTGFEHGTVTVVMPSGPIEVTTLRKDVATDGRHAQVAFGKSFKEDAERRDFTINALFEDAQGRIYDDVGGQADLKAGVLRFVGEAGPRIREDYLRILRLFRFWARFDFAPAEGTLQAVEEAREGLRQISQERITGELVRLLAGKKPLPALAAMVERGIWELILPELHASLPTPARISAWQAHLGPAHLGIAMLGGICLLTEHLSAADLMNVGERLRLSQQDCKRLGFFAEGQQLLKEEAFSQTSDLLDFIDRCELMGGPEAFQTVYAPVWMEYGDLKPITMRLHQAEALHGHLRRAKLPLTGRDLSKTLGIPPGPEVGRLLAKLKSSYRNGHWRSKDEGIALAVKLLPSQVASPEPR